LTIEKLELSELEKRAADNTLIGPFEVSNEDYHAGPGISRSDLVNILKSPLTYKREKVHPKTSEAMIFGSQFEEYLNDKTDGKTVFWSTHKAIPKGGRRSDRYSRHEVNYSTLTTFGSMAESIECHPTASELLMGDSQTSFYWKDPDTWILCKCRPDYLPGPGFIVDLKTSGYSVDPATFLGTCQTFGYYIQAAYYLWGMGEAIEQAKLSIAKPEDFILAVVEKATTYNDVGIYKFDGQALELGRNKIEKALRILKKCRDENHWPGLDTTPVTLTLNPWMFKQEVSDE